MSIKLGKHSFHGPVASGDKIWDKSGVYAVVCYVDSEYFLIDVGESSKLRTCIEHHDKKDCWIKNCKGQFLIYVHYTPFLKAGHDSGGIRAKDKAYNALPECCKYDRLSLK